MNSFIVWEKHKCIQNNSNYKLNGLGGNTHAVGLNAGDTQKLHQHLSGNSVLVHMSHGITKPLRPIKNCANMDGWSVSQTFSKCQETRSNI